MKQILTRERIAAMANINRWNGYTTRPFSVLEHTVIGLVVMQNAGTKYSRYEQRRFALHDVHESEIMGDIRRPHKARYCNKQYWTDVAQFDQELLKASGITLAAHLTCPAADDVDHAMQVAEAYTVALETHGYNAPVGQSETTDAMRLIKSGEYQGRLAIPAYNVHLKRLWPEWEYEV